MRHYEDLEIGETRTSAPRTLRREEMLEFARHYDPQYFHTDVEEAKHSIFGEVIASGIYTMAIWRQLDHSIGADIRWICGIAWDEVRWPLAVRSGDTLRARYTILEKRESGTHAQRGIIIIQYEMLNQQERLVWSARGTNLIERRGARAG